MPMFCTPLEMRLTGGNGNGVVQEFIAGKAIRRAAGLVNSEIGKSKSRRLRPEKVQFWFV